MAKKDTPNSKTAAKNQSKPTGKEKAATLAKDSKTPPLDSSKADKKKQPRVKQQPVRLPALVETVYSLATMLILAVAVVVAISAYLSGVEFFQIILRTGVSILITGILALVIAGQVSKGTVDAARLKMQEEQQRMEAERQAEAERAIAERNAERNGSDQDLSTMEFNA